MYNLVCVVCCFVHFFSRFDRHSKSCQWIRAHGRAFKWLCMNEFMEHRLFFVLWYGDRVLAAAANSHRCSGWPTRETIDAEGELHFAIHWIKWPCRLRSGKLSFGMASHVEYIFTINIRSAHKCCVANDFNNFKCPALTYTHHTHTRAYVPLIFFKENFMFWLGEAVICINL